MFRKSALAVAMLGAFASTNVVALGLGEIELKSALNQPLNAEVELLSATGPELEELKVSVASPQAFADAGIDRPLFLNKFQFNVGRNAEGKPVVRITSRDVVREPFLDFLLEMSWSKGRLVREYTVLVDPPVTMPAPAPVTQAPVGAGAAPVVTSAPARRVTHTAQLPPVSMSPGEYGPTKRNDTLWSIAEAVRPDSGVSVEQTMLGLLRANPEAFIDNNINNLKAGYVLRVPDRDELTSVSRKEASREARAQYAAWRAAHSALPTPAETAAQADGTTPGSGPAAAAGGEPSLQLVAPESTEAVSGEQGSGAALQTVQQELMLANEALEEQRRQSEEMSGRLSMLEEQIANMQRLIQLKDNELARLQAQAAGEVGSVAEPVEMPATVADTAESETVNAQPEPGETPTTAAEGVSADAAADVTAETPPEAMPEEESASADLDAAAFPEVADAGQPQTEPGGELTDEMAGEMAGTAPVAEVTPPPAVEPVATPAPEVTTPAAPESLSVAGIVDRLLANPLWLGAGAAVLVLLGFFGLRRKRGVETEFQESILQAAQASSSASDSEIVASEPVSKEPKPAHSSLLSEFAVSDMGSIRNDGEADPMAEADVYLAYGRYQQAEDLIRDALEKDSEREDLNLKLLEVYMAARNTAAFDEHAQAMLGQLGSSSHPVWEKVAEMGRELNPGNPIYQEGAEAAAPSDEDMTVAQDLDDEGLDFDVDLSYSEDQPDSEPFEPSASADEVLDADTHFDMDMDMDSIEPDAVAQKDEALEFNLDEFDVETETAASAEEEVQGDGELADLDEVSTKLDLARAYIDMGDPDGAKSILEEVMEEGSDSQKEEARGIVSQIA